MVYCELFLSIASAYIFAKLIESQGKYWTYVWYGTTVGASLLENFAGAPFTTSWKMRISRAPKVHISPDAPWVITPDEEDADMETANKTGATATTSRPENRPTPGVPVLEGLKKGYNTVGQLVMDPNEPWSASKEPFCVIISRESVFGGQPLFRLIAKLISVGTFTFSTALFASSTLVTILIATVVMITVLASAILGRVTAMWISAIIMRDRPVLHHVVKDEQQASAFIEEILRKDGLVCEVMGHIVINGRCVKRYRSLRWSSFFGVLAPPFDVTKICRPMTQPESRSVVS